MGKFGQGIVLRFSPLGFGEAPRKRLRLLTDISARSSDSEVTHLCIRHLRTSRPIGILLVPNIEVRCRDSWTSQPRSADALLRRGPSRRSLMCCLSGDGDRRVFEDDDHYRHRGFVLTLLVVSAGGTFGVLSLISQ